MSVCHRLAYHTVDPCFHFHIRLSTRFKSVLRCRHSVICRRVRCGNIFRTACTIDTLDICSRRKCDLIFKIRQCGSDLEFFHRRFYQTRRVFIKGGTVVTNIMLFPTGHKSYRFLFVHFRERVTKYRRLLRLADFKHTFRIFKERTAVSAFIMFFGPYGSTGSFLFTVFQYIVSLCRDYVLIGGQRHRSFRICECSVATTAGVILSVTVFQTSSRFRRYLGKTMNVERFLFVRTHRTPCKHSARHRYERHDQRDENSFRLVHCILLIVGFPTIFLFYRFHFFHENNNFKILIYVF